MEAEYLQIAGLVEAEFARNKARFGDRMRCGLGCTDCCHHLFDMDTMEARRIAAYVAGLPNLEQKRLGARARVYQQQYRQPQYRQQQRSRLEGRRLACAALTPDGACAIYPARPLVCRKFGMPIYDPRQPGQLKACELNFRAGEEIDSEGIVESQTEIHERWEALRTRDSDLRRWTVAAALLMGANADS